MSPQLPIVAFFVAATVVTLLHYVRVREMRVLPLLALFATLAIAHSREASDPWQQRFHLLAGVAGMVQLAVLGPRRA